MIFEKHRGFRFDMSIRLYIDVTGEDVLNVQSAELLASLRQEIAEFQDALNKQAEETAHHKAQGTAQVHNLNEVIRVLKEQNDEVRNA